MHLKNKLMTVGCVAVTAAALVAGMACNEHELSPFSKSLSAGKKQSLDSSSARNVDILFVVDDSVSMSMEQRGLDSNFSSFLDRLIDAGANFRLATVSTSHITTGQFNVSALDPAKSEDNGVSVLNNVDNGDGTKLTTSDLNAIHNKCQEYYKNGKLWIDRFDKEFATLEGDALRNEIRDYFRCQAIVGTGGEATERGLAAMREALRNTKDFKRPDSILAIVFVTDENDCSASDSTGSDKNIQGNDCELERNIEDSCIVTSGDQILYDTEELGSVLMSAPGQSITYNGETKSLRSWCVQGDDVAIQALNDCLNDEGCDARNSIDCPEVNGVKTCANSLDKRRDYYDFIIKEVMAINNLNYYKSLNPEKNLTFEEITQLAKQDVIVASIINRDRGVRYNDQLKEDWCGAAGTQGYRYQLFAEMFENDPIYAPICCKTEEYKLFSSAEDKDEVVCELTDNGVNSQFGPVLGIIGRRIGEAVNQLCAADMPVTCNPDDCKAGSPRCPCLHGCNEEAYLKNTENEYHLCNEFEFRVGVLPQGVNVYDADAFSKMESYEENVDYKLNLESNYCLSRTGSPIQLNMLKTENNKTLVFEYPKRVSAVD